VRALAEPFARQRGPLPLLSRLDGVTARRRPAGPLPPTDLVELASVRPSEVTGLADALQVAPAQPEGEPLAVVVHPAQDGDLLARAGGAELTASQSVRHTSMLAGCARSIQRRQ